MWSPLFTSSILPELPPNRAPSPRDSGLDSFQLNSAVNVGEINTLSAEAHVAQTDEWRVGNLDSLESNPVSSGPAALDRSLSLDSSELAGAIDFDADFDLIFGAATEVDRDLRQGWTPRLDAPASTQMNRSTSTSDLSSNIVSPFPNTSDRLRLPPIAPAPPREPLSSAAELARIERAFELHASSDPQTRRMLRRYKDAGKSIDNIQKIVEEAKLLNKTVPKDSSAASSAVPQTSRPTASEELRNRRHKKILELSASIANLTRDRAKLRASLELRLRSVVPLQPEKINYVRVLQLAAMLQDMYRNSGRARKLAGWLPRAEATASRRLMNEIFAIVYPLLSKTAISDERLDFYRTEYEVLILGEAFMADYRDSHPAATRTLRVIAFHLPELQSAIRELVEYVQDLLREACRARQGSDIDGAKSSEWDTGLFTATNTTGLLLDYIMATAGQRATWLERHSMTLPATELSQAAESAWANRSPVSSGTVGASAVTTATFGNTGIAADVSTPISSLPAMAFNVTPLAAGLSTAADFTETFTDVATSAELSTGKRQAFLVAFVDARADSTRFPMTNARPSSSQITGLPSSSKTNDPQTFDSSNY